VQEGRFAALFSGSPRRGFPRPHRGGVVGPTRAGAWRGAELILALLVVAVVAMMIVPLPTWLLDLLIAANLSASVAILLVVLYVPDALSIAAFPTLLLLTTLYRLALNVSSARLILLQANAGEIIHAFGWFVVRGNYVVGAIVFLILTLIQLVVIAKGSERVAEVGARFVLDALPGRQMAIDAELRAGSIDAAEARLRRRELARESQFYGAMDGAMKFVKGDVIASLAIILVCILGGLAVGVGQRGMDVTHALQRYGLLTIGDGLVTQIPALVLSTAAGVLVTRTASEEAGTPLGEELARQLFGIPKAMGIAALFIGLLALVPGLPAVPFLIIAAGLAVAARMRGAAIARAAAEPLAMAQRERTEGKFVPVVVPWEIQVSPDLAPLISPGGPLDARCAPLRDALFGELGVPLPPPRFRVDAGLPLHHARVALFEVPGPELHVPPHEADPAALLAEHALASLRARASDFLGIAETQRLLDELEQLAPAIVRNVVPKPVPLPVLADVLRRLVEERVAVRDLGAILEALATFGATEKDPLVLTEHVRTQLRRPITFRLTGGTGDLGVYLLDPIIEDTIRRAITRTPSGAFLTLPPASARDVVAAIVRAFGEAAPRDGAPRVVLTQPDIRRFVRKLLDTELRDAEVVSFAELLPEVNLRPLARANLAGL
jgi:type III secretion protein V